MAKSPQTACSPNLATLCQRSLLSPVQAGGLASVFKVLANDTRLRILHALIRGGDTRAGDLAQLLGMKPQALSNQLTRLEDLGILASRREGNSIHYRLVDLCISGLLEQGLCLVENAHAKGGLSERAAKCCADRHEP